MVTKYSKRLEQIAVRDPRVDSYEFDSDFGVGQHWLHLSSGWWLPYPDCLHSIHEATVSDTMTMLRQVARKTD